MRDRYAHFFLSWEWLSGWLTMIYEPWLILAYSPAGSHDPVAFLPLKFTLDYGDDKRLECELCMAGNSMADYTGLLCLPGYEQEAIKAFAQYILEQLKWSVFSLGNVLQSDPRVALLLRLFPGCDYGLTQIQTRNVGEETNHDIIPYTILSDTWYDYLRDRTSSNTRQKIRRFLRKVDASDELRIAETDADNLDIHLEILLDFWKSRWGEEKGEDCSAIMDYTREIIIHCFQHDCLHFPVLWQGDRPLGAISNFVDNQRKIILFFITGRDRAVKTPPPGLVLHAYAIRYAIQHGFKVYDFLRGNEEYKYSFGAQERHLKHIMVKPNHPRPCSLDARVVAWAVKLAVEQQQANRREAAKQGYRQILATQPDLPPVYNNLGYIYQQQGQWEKALTCYSKALELLPDCAEAKLNRDNARRRLASHTPAPTDSKTDIGVSMNRQSQSAKGTSHARSSSCASSSKNSQGAGSYSVSVTTSAGGTSHAQQAIFTPGATSSRASASASSQPVQATATASAPVEETSSPEAT